MIIMGVNATHDSSVAIIKDGILIADVAEERFTRVKHYEGLPKKSLEYCLMAAGITIDEVDIIAVPCTFGIPSLNFLFDLKSSKVEKLPLRKRPYDYMRRFGGIVLEGPPQYWKRFPLGYNTEIKHINHHEAHAAGAYYCSGINERTLVVTCDGVGDGKSLCIWRGENGKLELLEAIGHEGSLGWFYSNVTEALGWVHGDGEGKTMGLAPYGDYTQCQGVLDRFYPKYSAGKLVKPHSYGKIYKWSELGASEYHLDDANNILELVKKYGPENIAAEAQRILEEQMLDIIINWMNREKTNNLCCSGGVFLNVKLNQKIWYNGIVENHFIYPNAGDSGLAHGAALAVYHKMAGKSAYTEKLNHLYYGPAFSNEEIEKILKERKLPYKRMENTAVEAAKLLAENKIVAWFQGRMESGPRALGNRSILMSAARSENKDIINASIKFREKFRPFCPSMMDEDRNQYLNHPRSEPFMVTSFDAPETIISRIPAVVHLDNTLRPQTVERSINPVYWGLLNEYKKITGDSVLLNTSFNIKGEPIICHPREAIRCFFDTGLDHLFLGEFVLSK